MVERALNMESSATAVDEFTAYKGFARPGICGNVEPLLSVVYFLILVLYAFKILLGAPIA